MIFRRNLVCKGSKQTWYLTRMIRKQANVALLLNNNVPFDYSAIDKFNVRWIFHCMSNSYDIYKHWATYLQRRIRPSSFLYRSSFWLRSLLTISIQEQFKKLFERRRSSCARSSSRFSPTSTQTQTISMCQSEEVCQTSIILSKFRQLRTVCRINWGDLWSNSLVSRYARLETDTSIREIRRVCWSSKRRVTL